MDFGQLKTVLERCAKTLRENGRIRLDLGEEGFYSYAGKMVVRGEKRMPLAPKEAALLELLAAHRDKLVTREMIEAEVYDGEEMTGPALNNLVSKLRKKTGCKKIVTHSALGFILAK